MSNGDFEVMPIGTIVEIQNNRKFSKELFDLVDSNSSKEDLIKKLNEYRAFYHWHVETYPVTV